MIDKNTPTSTVPDLATKIQILELRIDDNKQELENEKVNRTNSVRTLESKLNTKSDKSHSHEQSSKPNFWSQIWQLIKNRKK